MRNMIISKTFELYNINIDSFQTEIETKKYEIKTVYLFKILSLIFWILLFYIDINKLPLIWKEKNI